MSTEDIEALQQLQNHKDIVIKPADKGGKIVIWPTDHYIQEAQRQLSDKKYYQLQNKDHTISTAYEISTFLTHLNKIITLMTTFLNFSSHTIWLEPPSFTCYQKFTSLTTLEGQ